MLNQLFERRLGLVWGQGRRLVSFLVLAAIAMTISIVSYAIGTSLFLSNVGPEAIPLFYLGVGLLSIPVSLGFSQVIDRFPRLQLFRALLLVALLLILGFRVLVGLDLPLIYYAINISVNLLDLLVNILLWTLLADYFTSLELKRYAAFLAMAMTTGGLMGGLLVRVLSPQVVTENLLWVLPGLYGVAIAQLSVLERSAKPLEATKAWEEPVSLLANLQTFPRLIARYPIVRLLAVGTLLAVEVWQISEFQFFSVYSDVFPDQQDLTGFLGLLSAWMSVLELLITYFVTRPLIHRWGVNRMNLVYPLTSLISFLGLAGNLQLPTAIVANINYETLSNSIATPVQNLNYNVLPYRFLGRVRVIIDGLVYPASQAIAGGLLLLQQAHLTPFQISLTGVGFSLAFWGVGYLTGQSYLQSLLAQLRSGSVSFDEVQEGLVRLPAHYVAEVQHLLSSSDPDAQLLGLELATRLEDPSPFLAEVQRLLPQADRTLRRVIVEFLSSCNHPNLNRYLRTQLVSDSAAVRAVVLEALILGQQPLSNVQLQYFLEDGNPEVQALACIATLQSGHLSPEIQAAYEQAQQTAKTLAAKQAIIRVVSQLQDPDLKPLLIDLLHDSSDTVKRDALESLAALASPKDQSLAILAVEDLDHAQPPVRQAALKVLTAVPYADGLRQLAFCLADPDPVVQQQATRAIAACGEASLPFLQEYLDSPRQEIAEAAITAIGQVRTRRAEDILFDYLQPVYAQVLPSLRWRQQINQDRTVGGPGAQRRWAILAVALQDYHEQQLHQVLHVLDSLGYASTLTQVRQMLRSPDVRFRANAVETLVSLEHRRFVQPILPLLEYLARSLVQEVGGTPPDPGLLEDILEAATKLPTIPLAVAPQLQRRIALQHRWLRIGALMALDYEQRPIPVRLLKDPDPLVRMVVAHLCQPVPQRCSTRDFFVNRLLFLRHVSLLESLSLDDLLLIDNALDQQDFLAGETIFKEGSLGETFYILYKGTVVILKKVKQTQRELARLEAGQYFGDMALFDNAPRSATVVAETDCTLLMLGRTHFQSLITQRPEIVLQMCKTLSDRLRDTNQRLG